MIDKHQAISQNPHLIVPHCIISKRHYISCVGPPLAPTISPIANADFKSFNVTLSTAGSSARCVLRYSLTITENGESLTALAIIGSNGTGSVGGLNLCKNMYTFSAVAMMKDMNSSSSGPVAGPVDFSGMLLLSVFNAVSKIKGKHMSKKFKIFFEKFFPVAAVAVSA